MSYYFYNPIKFKLDPASWVLNVLFPMTKEEWATEQDWINAGAPDERPLTRVMNAEQDRLFKLVRQHITDYYASNKPYQNSVSVLLALSSMYGEKSVLGDSFRGAYLYSGDADAMLTRLILQGQGAMDFMRYSMAQEVNVPPMLAVIRAEQLCFKYNLQNHRMPTGDGKDIVFSRTKIENPKFDNNHYIPSVAGYYSIVGKGAARD